MWAWIIPLLTLIVGGIGGFAIGVFYLRKQMMKTQSDPQMLQKMAKQMGYQMNSQQIAKAQQMMKDQKPGKKIKPAKNNRKDPRFRR